MMSPYGPAEKQAMLEAPDLKTRAEILIAVTEIGNITERRLFRMDDGTLNRGLPDSAVIGMVDAVGSEQRLRVAGDKDIRFELANDADDITAQIQVRDEIAVGAIHKVDRLHADHPGRGDLFLVPDGAQGVGGHIRGCGGVEALIAAGQKLIGDVMSGA